MTMFELKRRIDSGEAVPLDYDSKLAKMLFTCKVLPFDVNSVSIQVDSKARIFWVLKDK